MHKLRALAPLLVGLAVVFFVPTAQADCPHNGRTDHPHCGGVPSGDQSFFALMTDGDVVTLGTSWPLEVFAECTFDSGTSNHTVEVFVTSSEAGWFATPQGGGPLTMNQVVTVASHNSVIPLYTLQVTVNAVSPGGHYIGSNSFGLGTNLFGFNCLAAGQIITAQAP